jgi:P27 family predicted phage terminase small subunit
MKKELKITVPQGISVEAQNFINEVTDALNQSGNVTSDLGGALTIVMNLYDAFLKSAKEVREQGVTTEDTHGGKIISPAFNAMIKSGAAIQNYLKEFGLTAKSKAMIKSIATDEPTDVLTRLAEADYS